MSRPLVGYAVVLACTLAVTMAGSVALPIDDHEAFVVQTAQEMRERGDWIVPHFNGKPRLNKPPLSYWAVAALADRAGSERALPWQGRAPSIAGAVGLVALAMLLARLLTDHRIAVTTGIVAATSIGVFRYAHSARPDMLYAFWCTAVCTAFAWGARSPAPGRVPALVLWLAVALATLTKGPQLPLILLVACGIFARGSGWSMRRVLQTLRPVSGLALAIAIAAPWWWAVDRALPEGLGGTQLAGSLLTVSWSRVLDPYFFYRPLALVAPSVAVLVPALLWRRWPPWDEATRLCALLVLVPAAALTFGPQHRPHYMLPVLAPLSILLARTITAVRDGDRGRWATRALAVLWAATVLVEMTFASSEVLWSHRRFAYAALAEHAGTVLPRDVPVVALDTDAPTASYYAQRAVRKVRGAGKLPQLVDAAPRGALGLLTSADHLSSIPGSLEVTVLQRDTGDGDRHLLLARLQRPRT